MDSVSTELTNPKCQRASGKEKLSRSDTRVDLQGEGMRVKMTGGHIREREGQRPGPKDRTEPSLLKDEK